MKTLRLLIVTAIFTVIISLSAFAQAQPATAGKVGVVYSGAFFDEKAGITKVVGVYKTLATEFAARQNELQTIGTKLDALQKEIKALQDQDAKGVPINKEAAQSKVEEFEKLQGEGKFKQEQLKKSYETREAALLSPVFQDIGKTLGEFSKTKGFALVVDGSKDQAGMLIFVSEAVDITDEFVKVFNAKPAGTAAVTKPVAPK